MDECTHPKLKCMKCHRDLEPAKTPIAPTKTPVPDSEIARLVEENTDLKHWIERILLGVDMLEETFNTIPRQKP